MKTLVILVFWRYFDTIDKYCIANIIYLIGDTSNYGLSSIFLLCTQKNFRWLYAVGFALSLKHWWFYQSNPVLLYGLSRTERTVWWTSSQGPVIETSQLFQCIFEIKTMLGFIIIPSLLDIDMMLSKNWLDFFHFLLFSTFNDLSLFYPLLKNRASDYISTFMDWHVKGLLNFSRVNFSWNLWNILGVCENKADLIAMICGLFTEQCYGFTKLFISFLSIFFLNAVFHIMVDHASIPSPLILNGFSENV